MDKVVAMANTILGAVIDLGIKLIAAGVILQILFGAAVPFLSIDVVGRDRKSTRLNSSHVSESRMPSSA